MPKKTSQIKKSTAADVQDPNHGERKSTDNSSLSSHDYHSEKGLDPSDLTPLNPSMTGSAQNPDYLSGYKSIDVCQKTSGLKHRDGRKSSDNPNLPSRDYHNPSMTGSEQNPYNRKGYNEPIDVHQERSVPKHRDGRKSSDYPTQSSHDHHAGGDSKMMTQPPNQLMTGSKLDSEELTHNLGRDFLSQESRVRETSKKQKTKVDSVTQLSFIFMLVAVLSCSVVAYLSLRAPTTNSPTIPTRFDLYYEQLKKMHSKYKNQTERFWVTFLSSLEPILTSDDPDLPAVIMMAVPEDHHSMGLCFAQHVGEVIDKILDGKNSPSYVDGSKYSSLDADEQKVKIDEDIRKIVESEQRTVIVSGLEKIDPKAILLFHGYCDNSEAVFKNIAIIFLLKVPAESNYSRDEEVHAFLFKLWTVLGPAKTKALLARMANNVAIMQKSSHFIC